MTYKYMTYLIISLNNIFLMQYFKTYYIIYHHSDTLLVTS